MSAFLSFLLAYGPSILGLVQQVIPMVESSVQKGTLLSDLTNIGNALGEVVSTANSLQEVHQAISGGNGTTAGNDLLPNHKN